MLSRFDIIHSFRDSRILMGIYYYQFVIQFPLIKNPQIRW